MAANAGRAYVPLNGEEIKRIILQDVKAKLDADSRLKTHLAYHQVAFSVGIRLTHYPMDTGPILHGIEGTIGDDVPGMPRLEPPAPMADDISPLVDGNVQRDLHDVVQDRRGPSAIRSTSTTPGVKSYGGQPRGAVSSQVRRGITEDVQRAVRQTQRPSPASPSSTRRLERASPNVDEVPDPNDASVDQEHVRKLIESDGRNTVRQPIRTAGGQGDPIVGGAAPIPAGVAAAIHDAQASERAELEAFNLRQRLDAEAQARTSTTVITSPNGARQNAGLPIPERRATRGGGIADAPIVTPQSETF